MNGNSAMGLGLSLLRWMAGSELIERLRLRRPIERLVYSGSRAGFQVAGAAARQFKRVSGGAPDRMSRPAAEDLFDPRISDEQQLIRDNMQRFAREVLRGAADGADQQAHAPDDVLAQSGELGIAWLAVPESLGGAGSERSVISHMLIAEDLAHGDMGLAVSILSSIGVANALTHWGNGAQQASYLPAFLEEAGMHAAIAVDEPRALFNPFELTTRAEPCDGGYRLNGSKSLAPLHDRAQLFLVAAQTEQGPRLFIVESGAEGLSVECDTGMGVRAGEFGRLYLDGVQLPADALLGGNDFSDASYAQFIALAQLGWCALAVGTAQAVLDYVIPYCNERQAFGEPISHRQSVAFTVADIGIELESMRALLQRACARAERGDSFEREAYLARVLCADKAMAIGSAGVQLLGGHGFTREHPVERWYRDLRAVAVINGGMHL